MDKISSQVRWELRRLGEVCDINPSKKEISYFADDAEVTFLPMAAVSNDGFIIKPENRRFSTVRGGFSYFRENDVLFAKITPCMENGKSAIASNLVNGVGFGSTEFHIIRAKQQVIPEWIYFLVRQQSFREEAQSHMTGTAGQKRVPKQFLESVMIPVPPLETQKKLTAILNKASKLKQKRDQANHLANNITKPVFQKMFGDLSANPKSWEMRKLEDVCDKITDGTHKTPKYVSDGVPFLSVKNITSGYIDFSDTKFITREEHAEITKRCKPEKGDVLYTKVGTIGIACVVDTHREFSIFVSVALLKPKHEIVNSLYLKWLLNSPFVKNQAYRRVKGIGVPDLHLVEIKDFTIAVPPLSKQEEFARFVTKVEALRQRQMQSTRQVHELFESLMYKAFKGQLVA